MNLTSLIAHIYFSRSRALFSRAQIVAGTAAITILIYSIDKYLRHFRPDIWTPLIGQAGIVLAVLCGAVILANFGFIGYPGAGMMIRPDGAGMWSLHMGPIVSTFSHIYATMPKGFMEAGAIKILEKAHSCKFSGIVILESHILADQFRRTALINELSRNFPQWRMWECESKEKLKRFNARALTKHRDALMKKLGKPVGLPFETGAPLGMIVILAS